MFDKKPFESALGTFWIEGAPEQRMAGRLTVDGFPELTMFNVGTRQTVTTKPRQTIHGVTDSGQYVSFFGTLGTRSGWSKRREDISELRPAEVCFGAGVQFTANCMVLGEELHSNNSLVHKITFTSAVAEHFFHLNASSMLESLRFRKSRWDKTITVPVASRKLRTVYVAEKRIKVRLIVSALPNESSSPKARWQIDFIGGVSLDTAVRAMQDFRDLLTVLCNEFVDIQNPLVLYQDNGKFDGAELVFYNFRSHYEGKDLLATPMVSLASDQEKFYKVVRAWILEPSSDKIARRAFAETLRNTKELQLGDIRAVVTLLEMKAREKFKPISTADFRKLRTKLRAVIDEEIKAVSSDVLQASGLQSISDRLDNLNAKDARLSVKLLIETIAPNYRSEIIADPAAMAKEIVDLRNDVTHDLSRLNARSYRVANTVVHVLRWLYAVIDAQALNLSVLDLNPYFKFHRYAMNVHQTVWSRDDEPDQV